VKHLGLLLLSARLALAHDCHDALPLGQYQGGAQLLGWWEKTSGEAAHLLITPDSLYWDGIAAHLEGLETAAESTPEEDHGTPVPAGTGPLPPFFARSPRMVFAGLLGVYDEVATDDYLCMVGGLSNGNFIWAECMFDLEGDLLSLRFHPGEPGEQLEVYLRGTAPTAVVPASWGTLKGPTPLSF
jgi:hypothetical protein